MFNQAEFKTLIATGEISNVLKKDSSKKQAITALQQVLYELGFEKELKWSNFGADGDFGNATAAAVSAFAAKNDLESNGETVSPEVAEKMALRFATVADVRSLGNVADQGAVEAHLVRGSNHRESVKALQRLLNHLGFGAQLNWERFGADGDYGKGTAAAVAAFGEQETMTTDGERVSRDLCDRLLGKFTPFLGDGWKDVKANAKGPVGSRTGQSQYEQLFPVSDKDAKAIQHSLSNRYRFKKLSHDIPGEDLKLQFLALSRKDNDASYFFHKEVEKKRIVLHFTAGQITGDIPALSIKNGDKVSTLFVIGRDGTAYKMFPKSKQWAWHIGKPGTVGTNKVISPTSVGIELSNWGPLREDGRGGLVTWDHGHWFCNLDQTDAYVKVSKPYRGATYFASLTPEQYESVIVVLRYLTRQLGIPPNFLPKGQRDQVFGSHREAQAFEGICCHTNFRPSGKWDFCEEAFDWEQVIAGLTADTFEPRMTHKSSRQLIGGSKLVTEAEAAADFEGMDGGNQDPDAYGEDGPEVDI